jgi:putative NADPH-quinone reductase
MRVLLVFAHPVETSYGAALKDTIVQALSPRHEVDLLDLHAERFDPVMSREERMGYHTIPDNIGPVAPYVERLMRAEALVFCFPAWSFGPPAILKGWLDRVMVPGVSFHLLPDGRVRGGLTHLRKLGAVVTYGQPRWRARVMGDYPRRLVTRYLRRNIGWWKEVVFLGYYGMNVSTAESRGRFMGVVREVMGRF